MKTGMTLVKLIRLVSAIMAKGMVIFLVRYCWGFYSLGAAVLMWVFKNLYKIVFELE